MVARINRDTIEDTRLEEFLFGAERIPLERVRGPLRELQDNTFLFCGRRMKERAEVDYSIPWARYPDNGIENLVLADPGCNSSKRDFLAAAEHVAHWVSRMESGSNIARGLTEIANTVGWEAHGEKDNVECRPSHLPATSSGGQAVGCPRDVRRRAPA